MDHYIQPRHSADPSPNLPSAAQHFKTLMDQGEELSSHSALMSLMTRPDGST